MENSSNRIFDEVNAWNQKVDDLKAVFGNHVTDYRYLITAKLGYFKQIEAKYNTPVSQDEKISFKVLKAEIRRLEKIAFPKRIDRFIRKSIESVKGIITKVQGKTRLEHQFEMKKEFYKRPKEEYKINEEKDLSKTYSQYKTKLKAVKNTELLPKLRNSNGKGMNI